MPSYATKVAITLLLVGGSAGLAIACGSDHDNGASSNGADGGHVTSSAGDGGGLGAGDSGSKPLGTTAVTFSVTNRTGHAVSQPVVTMGHPFAQGDIQGHLALFAADGVTSVPVQEDQDAYWADGSLRFAALSFVAPGDFTDGQSASFVLKGVAGAPSSAPSFALADLAKNSDIKLKFSGGDAAGDTFTVSVNDIIANGKAWPAWGTSPLMGYEPVRSGAIANEWRFWAFLKRDSDAAVHRWVKSEIWVRAWSATGPFEVYTYTKEANVAGPVAGATVGPDMFAGRFATVAELYNGTTLLQAFGGANDSRTVAIPASSFDVATNRLTLPATWPQATGVGVTFATAAALPSGLSANAIYWPTVQPDGTAYLASDRLYAADGANPWMPGGNYFLGSTVVNNGIMYVVTAPLTGYGTSSQTGPTGTGDDIVDGTLTWKSISPAFGKAGSGTTSMSPVSAVFAQTGWVGATADADPIWIGSGDRPEMLVSQDFLYLTQKTKAVPPLDPTIAVYGRTASQRLQGFGVNQPIIPWDLNITGDNPGDERIGYLSNTQASLLYVPSDLNTDRDARIMAFAFADYWIHFDDERSGRPLVGNAGPDRMGGAYPDLGPSDPSYFAYLGQIKWDAVSTDQSGYVSRYGTVVDASHLPTFWYAPYLRTGHQIFLEIGLETMNGNLLSTSPRLQTIGTTTYANLPVANQTRGVGWATRAMGEVDYVIAAADPLRAYVKDSVDDHAAYLAAWYRTQTGPGATAGAFNFTGLTEVQPWMYGIMWTSYAMEAWRGERPGFADFLTNYESKFFLDLFDTDQGGCDYYLGKHTIDVSTDGTDSTDFPDVAAMYNADLDAGWTCPPDGLGNTDTPYTPLVLGAYEWPWTATMYSTLDMAALNMAATAGIPNAEKLRARVAARLIQAGGIVWSEPDSYYYVTGPYAYPAFAIAEPGTTVNPVIVDAGSDGGDGGP